MKDYSLDVNDSENKILIRALSIFFIIFLYVIKFKKECVSLISLKFLSSKRALNVRYLIKNTSLLVKSLLFITIMSYIKKLTVKNTSNVFNVYVCCQFVR